MSKLYDEETGVWLMADKNTKEHVFDKSLASAIQKVFELEDAFFIADLGCGLGSYLDYLNPFNFETSGFDGNPNTPELTNGKYQVLDLSKPVDLPDFDWVLSLEVGEHINPQHEVTFINNLTKTANQGIILSWAIPGQDGLGHCNCQTNEYIIARIEEKGFAHVPALSDFLRHYASLSWFKHTLMVFKRNTNEQN